MQDAQKGLSSEGTLHEGGGGMEWHLRLSFSSSFLFEDVAHDQKTAFPENPCKFRQSGYSVNEEGKNTFTEKGIEGLRLKGQAVAVTLDEMGGFAGLPGFEKEFSRKVETRDAGDALTDQVIERPSRTTSDV